jgi:hypothetical protein
MGFNRRKMEDQRRTATEKEAAARRATDAQVLEDAERLIAAWNERQAKRMPMLFAPTIGAALAARHWFLWVYCPACRNMNAIDLRTLDRHHDAAVTSLIPALSCRSCRPTCAVRRARAAVTDQHRGRNARGAGIACRGHTLLRRLHIELAVVESGVLELRRDTVEAASAGSIGIDAGAREDRISAVRLAGLALSGEARSNR